MGAPNNEEWLNVSRAMEENAEKYRFRCPNRETKRGSLRLEEPTGQEHGVRLKVNFCRKGFRGNRVTGI